jgi:hypothetical protein
VVFVVATLAVGVLAWLRHRSESAPAAARAPRPAVLRARAALRDRARVQAELAATE